VLAVVGSVVVVFVSVVVGSVVVPSVVVVVWSVVVGSVVASWASAAGATTRAITDASTSPPACNAFT